MNNVKPFIPKDEKEMPDVYGVELCIYGGKPQKYEVVRHRIFDKVFALDGSVVGPHACPFWEFELSENDELMCVPMAMVSVKFDSRWWKICDLAKKKVQELNDKTGK